MKRTGEFMLQTIGENSVLIPFGQSSVKFNGVLKLNSTAKFLWDQTENEFTRESLIEEIKKEFNEATEEQVLTSVDVFINQLQEVGAIE